MDKYEDLGLEASKFIEDLNMYEASRDGLFRMRRDAGNNPDFEETRRVFASKMTKIHMQKQQEEIAKNNQAIRMNGGHNSSGYYTKDRPPINSYRQPAEAAAKPPLLSAPVSGTTGGSQYAPFDVQKHHSASQPESPTGRMFGYGNNYDNKEPHSYQHGSSTPPSSPGKAPNSAPTHARHPVSQQPAWAPSRENQFSSSKPGSEGSNISHHQPQHLPAPPAVNSLPPQQSQAVSNQSPPSSVRGWTSDGSGTVKPELIPTLPLSAFTGGADFSVQQQKQHQGNSTQPTTHYASSSPPSTTRHNGPTSVSSVHPAPPETTQVKTQLPSVESVHHFVPRSINQGQGQRQTPIVGQAVHAEPEVQCPPKSAQLPLAQPAEQGPSSAEIKLEALTKRLEKEMDAQPKADYFGKSFSSANTNKEAFVSLLPPLPSATNKRTAHSQART